MISLRSFVTTTVVLPAALLLAACADQATSPLLGSPQDVAAASRRAIGTTSLTATSSQFPYGVVALGNLSFTGNSGTDSYVGTYGAANVRANGNVAATGNLTLTGNPRVSGGATVGGVFKATGHGQVTGGVSYATAPQLAALTAPICPAGYTPSAELPGVSHGSYNQSTGVLRLVGNTHLVLSGASQYHFSQIVLTGNANVQVDVGSQPVTIFVDDLVDLTGGGLLNSSLASANVALVGCGSSTTTWKLTGNTRAYFCVYAPNHDVNFTGNSDLFGALVGRNVSSTGNGKFHYDEDATANGACGGPPMGPDISAGALQIDVGNGPQNITSTSPTVLVGQPVTLVQWISLVGGPAPGSATCTLTVTQGTTSTTLPGVTVNMPTSNAVACQVPYTFASATTYSIQSVVTVPAGQTDPNTANNTASAQITVTAPAAPTVHAAVTSLDFSESDESIAQQVFAPTPTNAAADSIHSGAAVTYRATVAASAFLGGATSVTATCSATDNGSDVTNNVSWHAQTVTLTPAQPTGYCSFDYTITENDPSTSHPHTIAVSVSTAPVQNTAGASATLSGVVTVPAKLPKASVAISELDYSDQAEGISSRSFAPPPPEGAAADSVHSGDVATYSAAISASNFQNATTVPTVTCSATVDGQPVTSGWVNQTITGLSATAPAGTCSFTKTFNETDNQPHPHTVAFSIVTATTGSFTNTATTGQSATGTINSVRRADAQAGALQILDANGQPQPLSALAIKQGASATLQYTVTNTASVATSIDCGALLRGDGTSPTELSPQTLAPTTVALGAAGSGTNAGVCKYSISAPAQLALINIALMSTATTTANFPLDPVPSNNTASGSLRVQSSGKFTVLPTAQSIVPVQQWTNPTAPTATSPIDLTSGILSQQQLNVSQLALLVIPTQAQLGIFNLEATVYTKTAAGDSIFMGTGTAPIATGTGTLPMLGLTPVDPLVGGTNCTPTSTTATPLGIGSSGLAYAASICASPSGATNQQITVSYDLTSAGATGANAVLFRDNTYLKIKLRFNLDPTATVANDSVTATIQVPINQLIDSCSGDPITGSTPPYYCQSSFKPAIITTP